jgi:hypothetical protein
METPEITIPEGAYPAIRNLIDLPPEHFEAFLSALSQSKPAVVPNIFSKHVSELVPQIDASKIESIVDELFTMDQVRDSWDIPAAEFAELLGDAAISQNSDDFPFTEKDEGILQERVKRLFETKSALNLTAKAVDVITDRPNLFYHAKLYTDIRPVFDESGKAVQATVLLHNLRIHYRGENGDHKDIVMALDTTDIKSLKKLLERADQKADTLKGLLKRSQIDYLDIED